MLSTSGVMKICPKLDQSKSIHLRLLDAVPVRTCQSLATEVYRYGIDACIRWSGTFDHFVHGNVRFATVHRAQRQAALLQLRLWIVPVLVHDKVLQAREQTHVTEHLTVLEPFVDVQCAQKCFE
uniref:Uncharacterized protein n=1 Tax=Anopheles culicifacies TaxID=139723 RepID=A0A182M1A2_9DIPT